MPRTRSHASPTGGQRRLPSSPVFVIASLLMLSLIAGCSGQDVPRNDLDGESPSSVGSEIDPGQRLDALGHAWARASATITYRTTAPVLGQPTTAHLCLRQMFDDDYGRKDRAALLRRCSRQGSLRLVWDPSDGWQMDVTTPVDRFTLASTHYRTRICPDGDPHACHRIGTAEAIGKASADIFFERPRKILAAIGATGVREAVSTEYAGLPVECFAATGRDEHVEWCYSVDGLLLSFLRGSAAGGWTSFEATSVSEPGAA